MYTPTPNPLRSKTDLQNAFLALEESLLARWDPNASGLDLGPNRGWYGIQATRLETVARYLWGLVPFTAGGGISRGWPLVLDAIIHGTDPNHPQYWGEPAERDQRSVEMASLGVALRLVSDKLWDPLSPEQKDRFANWLGSMVDKPLVESNWQFFRLLVTMGLRHIGRAPTRSDEMDQQAITVIDSMYLGDGWYSDGKTGQRDYYIPMAFQFYGILLAHLAEGGPVVARAADWKQRADRFGQDFIHWFSSDGAGLAFGRSLTYRFAAGAFWGGCAIAGVNPFSSGELKGMLLRHLRWWWRQPILNGDGVLSLGYAYPNANMLEPYNAAGSPYWGFKAFAALQLPEAHPFWSQDERPMPELSSPSAQIHPNFLIDCDPDTGQVTTLNAGQWHAGWPLRHRDAKYAKLSYSTFFGPCVGPNHEWLTGTGIDGTISVLSADSLVLDGTLWRNRGETKNQRVTPDHVVSDWLAIPGVSIRSWLAPAGPAWHARVHRVQTDHAIQFAEGGFAAAEPEIASRSNNTLLSLGQDGGQSGMIDLSGGRDINLNDVEPNSSLYYSRVKIPVLVSSLKPGTYWIATAVFGAAPGSKAAFDKPPRIEWVAGSRLTIKLPTKLITISLEVHSAEG